MLATTTADPKDTIESLMTANVHNVSTAQMIFNSAKKIMKNIFNNNLLPKSNSDDPVEQEAFHFYPPNWKGGQHCSVGRESNKIFNLAEAVRKGLS